MSKERIEIIKCPKCGAEGGFTIWDSINVELNPELKETELRPICRPRRMSSQLNRKFVW